MKINKPDIPKKYQPRGFRILHEDLDLIVGIKSAGYLTVAAAWDRENSVHAVLGEYVRKGNGRSTKQVLVVHRLDQATSGLLVFAKSERVQSFLKDNWKTTVKTYFTVVHGKLKKKKGLIESYLSEDDEYVVHSTDDSLEGRLAKTEYEVVHETSLHSLVKINLLTGRKNQIRVHMAELGNPVVGDSKYGPGAGQKLAEAGLRLAQTAKIDGRAAPSVGQSYGQTPTKTGGKSGGKFGDKKPVWRKDAKPPVKVIREIALHAQALEFTHPHSKERYHFEAPVPSLFHRLMPGFFETGDEPVPSPANPRDGGRESRRDVRRPR